MTLGAAIQNAAILASPASVYAVVVRWRAGLPLPEIAARLGLSLGKQPRPLYVAFAACVPAVGNMAGAIAVLGWTA